MDPATIQYRLHLPHALHPISPSLAALHTSRAAALHPEIISAVLHPTHCPKCGTYQFSGDRPPDGASKKRKRAAYLRRKCHRCGFLISPPLDNASGTGTVPTIPAKEIGPGQRPPPSDVPSLVRTTESAPTPPFSGQQSKPGHAKTLTLKEMLSRDRQREEDVRSQKKRKEDHDGLAAFLKQL